MSLKRIISLVLCLTLLAGAAPALAAEGADATPAPTEGTDTTPAPAEGAGPIPISNVDELFQLGNNPTGSYYLTRDLNMAGVEWVPVAFRGTLDGGGHSIFNLKVTAVGADRAESVDGNNNAYDTVYAGLFSTLTDAKISNLTLQGVDVEITSPTHCFIGALAGYIKGAEIVDCAVLDARLRLTVTAQPEDVGQNARGLYRVNTGLGGVAGFGSGFVTSCQVDATLIYDDQSAGDGLRVEEFLGGVLSTGNAGIQDCAVKIQGYDACRGYVHNGGLMGMYYLYDKSEAPRPIIRNSVDGQITFYENNPDRRAYCQSFVGEVLSGTNIADNTPNFQRNELYDYTLRLDPEKCDVPALTEEVRPADCYGAGYTVHTCAVCGHTWRDSFVPVTHQPGEWEITTPATYESSGVKVRRCALCGQVVEEETINPHVAGDWTVVREADYGVAGLRQRLCTDCGEVLEEETIPALVAVTDIALEDTALEMKYQDSAVLRWTVYPADATNTMVKWETSDSDVVTVDTNGTVNAVGSGTATVSCISADGFARAECTVRVKLTPKQWIQRYLLFGWVKKH